jgi:hypothetical protein
VHSERSAVDEGDVVPATSTAEALAYVWQHAEQSALEILLAPDLHRFGVELFIELVQIVEKGVDVAFEAGQDELSGVALTRRLRDLFHQEIVALPKLSKRRVAHIQEFAQAPECLGVSVQALGEIVQALLHRSEFRLSHDVAPLFGSGRPQPVSCRVFYL